MDAPEDERRLDSWKEIAAFFGRDPRTVKRWEKQLALPVHRIPGRRRSGVYAYAHELRRWLEPHQLEAEPTKGPDREPVVPAALAPSASVETLPPPWRRGVLLALLLLVGTAGLLSVAGWSSRLSLARSRHKSDPEIGHAYLECRYLWSKRTAERLHEAVGCFTRLIERDPRFAPAYAGLADSYNLLREYSLMPDGEAFPRAIAAAKKALELDPASSLGHRSLAFAAFNWSFDAPTAEREFRTAIALDPRDAEAHHWFATTLMLLGRHAEAVAEIGRAQELEPTSSSILADQGFILYAAAQQSEALELLARLARTEPDLVSPHRYLADVHFKRADYQMYLVEARRFAELLGDPQSLAALAEEEKALADGGAPALLERLLIRRLTRYEQGSGGAYPVGQVESLLGRREQALTHLEEACARHEPAAMAMGVDPTMANLHEEPGFRDLLGRLGLSQVLPGGPSRRAAR